MTEGLGCVNHGGSSLTVSLEYVWALGVWQATAALHGNTGAKLDFVQGHHQKEALHGTLSLFVLHIKASAQESIGNSTVFQNGISSNK